MSFPFGCQKEGIAGQGEALLCTYVWTWGSLVRQGAVYININDHFLQFSKADDENGVAHKGKDRDVGEVLVKSLQNTKYSLDEKLENSFISLFAKKINLLSEAPSEREDAHKSMDRIKDIEPAELDQSGGPETDDSDEESDAEELDGSETSDKDKTYQEDLKMTTMDNESDEYDNNVLEEDAPPRKGLKEHIDFHDGRMRRKAFFGEDFDDDHSMENSVLF